MEPEILDSYIFYKNGCYARRRTWLKGMYPDRGRIYLGLSGFETIEEKDVIVAIGVFDIKED